MLQQAHHLIDDLPVPDGTAPGVPVNGLHAAVAALRLAPGSPEDLADHLTAGYPAVLAAADAAQAYAGALQRQRDTGWRAVAAELRAWVDAAGELPERERTLARLKAARAWLKGAGAQLRNQRLAPIDAHSQRILAQLRQESNAELGAMTLAGTNTRRRVVFPVSVDGAENGTALGVMSQDEMHALGHPRGILPRGGVVESPSAIRQVGGELDAGDDAQRDDRGG